MNDRKLNQLFRAARADSSMLPRPQVADQLPRVSSCVRLCGILFLTRLRPTAVRCATRPRRCTNGTVLSCHREYETGIAASAGPWSIDKEPKDAEGAHGAQAQVPSPKEPKEHKEHKEPTGTQEPAEPRAV